MKGNTIKTTFYVLFILVLITCSTYFTNVWGRYYYEQEFRVNQVFDILHQYTPDFHKYELVINILPVLCILAIVFFSSDALEEFALKLLLIYLIRALTTLTTILPKHEKCEEKEFTWVNAINGGCYDKIFSGHSAITFLGSLLLYRENVITLPVFAGVNIVESLLIILTRAHYTIDVLLGILITYLVYDGDYHIFTDFMKKLKV